MGGAARASGGFFLGGARDVRFAESIAAPMPRKGALAADNSVDRAATNGASLDLGPVFAGDVAPGGGGGVPRVSGNSSMKKLKDDLILAC